MFLSCTCFIVLHFCGGCLYKLRYNTASMFVWHCAINCLLTYLLTYLKASPGNVALSTNAANPFNIATQCSAGASTSTLYRPATRTSRGKPQGPVSSWLPDLTSSVTNGRTRDVREWFSVFPIPPIPIPAFLHPVIMFWNSVKGYS